jgi:hypothetical protein
VGGWLAIDSASTVSHHTRGELGKGGGGGAGNTEGSLIWKTERGQPHHYKQEEW